MMYSADMNASILKMMDLHWKQADRRLKRSRISNQDSQEDIDKLDLVDRYDASIPQKKKDKEQDYTHSEAAKSYGKSGDKIR